MNNVVYIFDVDGVITDPVSLSADPRIIEQISELVNRGLYVAFNTGRGYQWVKDDIVEAIREQVSPERLSQMFVSAEMGGVTVKFNAAEEQDNSTAFSLLSEQIERVRHIYEAYQHDSSIAWYEGKISMATIYRPANVDSSLFQGIGKEIVSKLEDEFQGERIKITLNPDAIDVTVTEAGKWAGAQLIADWLQTTPVADTKHFVCLGDNTSDYEMARFFGHQGHRVDFVFMGNELGSITNDLSVSVVKPDGAYNEGTFSYLSKELGSSPLR